MKIIAVLLLFVTAGCSTLAPIGGGVAGAALGAAVAGPGGAAAGAGVGVATAQMAFPNEQVDTTVALAAAQAGIPAPGTTASTLHEATSFIHEIGWWYLLIFVLFPLITKRGRTWMKKFTEIHNTVSQADIDARDEEQDERIRKIEEMLEKKTQIYFKTLQIHLEDRNPFIIL